MSHPFIPFVVAVTTMAMIGLGINARPVAAQPPAGHAGGNGTDSGAQAPISGKVIETMDSGGYTYVQVDAGGKKLWAAGPLTKVAVGDSVILPDGVPMHDFASKTLNRTFDVVYFVSAIKVVGAQAMDEIAAAHGKAGHAAGQGMPGHGAVAAAPPADVDLSNIKKAEGGQTVADLFANKAALAGKDVVVRGRVVKFTPNVMGKNWLHVRDGSGSAGSNDLTVSTSATAAVGNMVVVRGKLVTDRDLGAGYHYDIIIEDAAVAVE